MFKAEQVDGDHDYLRNRLLIVKDFLLKNILPKHQHLMGYDADTIPSLAEIMAVAVPPEVSAEVLGWQQLHQDARQADPYSILCAVTNEYYFDARTTDEEGDHRRVRIKMDAGDMTILRGDLPHCGGPTTAMRLHLSIRFSQQMVSMVVNLK